MFRFILHSISHMGTDPTGVPSNANRPGPASRFYLKVSRLHCWCSAMDGHLRNQQSRKRAFDPSQLFGGAELAGSQADLASS